MSSESQGALPRSNSRVSSLATCCGPRSVDDATPPIVVMSLLHLFMCISAFNYSTFKVELGLLGEKIDRNPKFTYTNSLRLNLTEVRSLLGSVGQPFCINVRNNC